MQPNAEMIHDVADQAAKYWIGKGIKSYTYEDMYQDAALAALNAATKYKSERGDLRGYCFTAARNEVRHRMTRAIAPVSARGHDKTSHLGTLRKVSFRLRAQGSAVEEVALEDLFTETMYRRTGVSRDIRKSRNVRVDKFPEEDPSQVLDQCAWRGRVLARIKYLTEDVEDADLAIMVIMKAVAPRDLVEEGYERRYVSKVVAKVKRLLADDRQLYELAKDIP